MRIPTATYRVQLEPDFGFGRLAGILDYLADLGVSDIYASPVFKARKGSRHGYDVLDPNRLNPQLGSEKDWQDLTRKRRAMNLGWLQDIVPNHMVYSGENPAMVELFEKGPRPGPAEFFDITWDHPRPELKGRVSAPFLGAPLEHCLENGEITLAYDAAGLFFVYYEHRFPAALHTYPLVFGTAGGQANQPPQVIEWLHVVEKLSLRDHWASLNISDLKKNLWSSYNASQEIRQFVARQLQDVNAAGSARLPELLGQQYFHLDFWQTATQAINYRRFFSINDLIAVRQEDHRIFDRTHTMIAELMHSGVFTGLRVDHIDGLLTPRIYLNRLRQACGDGYIIVEKILAAAETLPGSWPVQGTTGYEFAAHLDRLFTFSENKPELDRFSVDFCGTQPDFETVVRQSKTEVLESHFCGDLDNLAAKFRALCEFQSAPAEATDTRASALREALALILINMPVYRTYLSDGSATSVDSDILSKVVSAAASQRPDLTLALHRVQECLLSAAAEILSHGDSRPADDPQSRAVGAFEQLCAAMAAKGVEDTALYRFSRLTALNEVGGDPDRFGESPREFHQFAQQRQRHHPHTLNVLSTHDSKRSGDVRARLLVLSEIPRQWTARVKVWRQMNQMPFPSGKTIHRTDTAMEYFLYQTLAATCPAGSQDWDSYMERIAAYMIKAAREAKIFTSWSAPDQAYEAGLNGFIHRILGYIPGRIPDRILDPRGGSPFIADLRAFAATLAYYGSINTLAQTLIQITAPGIPDIYQGTELADDSLVDPDNRRPVDYEKRRRCLADIRQARQGDVAASTANWLKNGDYDRVKLYLTYVGLQARRQAPELFARGDYLPLVFDGRQARHGIAFARIRGSSWYVTVVPRFLSRMAASGSAGGQADIWQDTRLVLPEGAPRQWRNVLTKTSLNLLNGNVGLQNLFATLPVALITAEA